jgi:hypothetical protein
MLFMIGTQTTIVWTSIMRFCVESIRCLGWFVIVPDVLVVRNIVGDQDLRSAMFGTSFEHVNLLIFEDNLRVDPL